MVVGRYHRRTTAHADRIRDPAGSGLARHLACQLMSLVLAPVALALSPLDALDAVVAIDLMICLAALHDLIVALFLVGRALRALGFELELGVMFGI